MLMLTTLPQMQFIDALIPCSRVGTRHNAMNTSVRCEQKRLQKLSETVPANNRIPQAVRQGMPEMAGPSVYLRRICLAKDYGA